MNYELKKSVVRSLSSVDFYYLCAYEKSSGSHIEL